MAFKKKNSMVRVFFFFNFNKVYYSDLCAAFYMQRACGWTTFV